MRKIIIFVLFNNRQSKLAMTQSIQKLISKIKNTRMWRRIYLFWGRMAKPKDRISRPKGMSKEVDTAMLIWERVVLNPNSNLLYNPENSECFAHLDDYEHPIFMFLEQDKIRIINSEYGYDVSLEPICEKWCSQQFNRELSRRRDLFKTAALSRVNYSLSKLESYVERM